MADLTQDQRLQNYIDAEKKALVSQEYETAGGRRNRRADLSQIREGVDSLLAGGAGGTALPAGSRARRVVLRDL
ncbi:hypothetical protein [Anaeroselena agilis]|uniref:Uncharacterized protein n=1 Tax=Anaeroselena agilis TaxID=3063788 RepID=A0ABU3NYH8_9FIRM|nr:hypothetical protein [Selenomonadales bacterium 4137-cl]